jgi:ligand-binding SRPBCC domain-containing protein
MPLICLETFINASPHVVFDLSRSVDLHKASMTHHKEEVVDGIKNGLMEIGDVVTWKATHLFKSRMLTVKITALKKPLFFVDEMVAGDFKKMRHEHKFSAWDQGTLMIDRFYFETPFGVIGNLANYFFLKNYMTRLLAERNSMIKKIAESNQVKQYFNI